MILNWGKTRTALFLGGSHTTFPTYAMIGSGSGTIFATQTELIIPVDRNTLTTIDNETTFKIKYTGDWNSVRISGLGINPNPFALREWGLCINKPGTTGSMWSRTAMPTAITFDGTTELRIDETWEVY